VAIAPSKTVSTAGAPSSPSRPRSWDRC